MQQKRLDMDWDWIKQLGFAPGIRVGDTIHTCGMVAMAPNGELVGKDDVYAQAIQVYRNLAAVLAEEGATMADVVKTTTWLPDMSRYQDYARARAETFPDAIPCSTTVESKLVSSDFLIEIEAVAVVGSSV